MQNRLRNYCAAAPNIELFTLNRCNHGKLDGSLDRKSVV